MSEALYIVSLYLALALIISSIMCRTTVQTPCQQASSAAQSYIDCKNYDNTTAETICCYVQGAANNTGETGCLDVDVLFTGKTIAYSSNGVSGKMICQSVTSSAKRHLLKTMLLTLIIILIY